MHAPPYGWTTIMLRHQVTIGGRAWTDSLTTPGGLERESSGSKNKRASPYAIHVCELDPFLAETIEIAGV